MHNGLNEGDFFLALEGDEAEANLSSLKHKRLGIVHMRGGDLAILFLG